MIKAMCVFYSVLIISYLIIMQTMPPAWMVILVSVATLFALLEDSIKNHITKTMEKK